MDKFALTVEDLTKIYSNSKTKKINIKVENIDINKILKMEGVQFKINSKNSISVIYEKNSFNFSEIINYLNQNGVKILDIVTEDGDLEDVFVQLTNN